ncbi:MAG: hypothetical protein JW953_24190 [Anaerolineae bacterium]|nr:hypothetical protein [Anaerolineae bacterium]
MRCPKCDDPTYTPSKPCPNCQFAGDEGFVEELAHVKWMLGESNRWRTLGIRFQDQEIIQREYLARQRNLEVKLGLRLPPFTEEEAQEAWPELFQREALLQKMAEWSAANFFKSGATQKMVRQASQQREELLEQLAGHPRPTYPQTNADRLDVTQFLLEAVNYLSQNQCFINTEAEAKVRAPLLAEKDELETKLGLRSPGEVAAEQVEATSSAEVDATQQAESVSGPASPGPSASSLPAVSPPQQPSPTRPAVPLSERLWQTLLSERTLQALLFLGIFLLFAAAISFVIWGWKDFSAPMRVAIPTIFTIIFFGLGWYVRAKTSLYRSGIALSAIAALLIPIDFYTVYVNFHIPPDLWPFFWFVTSVFCLIAYSVAAFIIRSRFFGYLIGVAAGSVALALIQMGHQAFGLSTDWRIAGLSIVALGLTTGAAVLNRYGKEKLRFLTDSFRYLSLLTVSVIMPLAFGWRFLGRDTYDPLHYALTVSWWCGCFIFGWGAFYYRSRSLGVLAAIALPGSTFLTQAAVFNLAGISPAWHAFGLALLVPLYFIAGYRLLADEDDPVVHSHGRVANWGGVVLLVVAALWPVMVEVSNGTAAASTYAVLTGAAVLTSLLWQRPTYLYLASVFSLLAITFVMTELELSWAQLSVGWASLAIAHILVALSLGSRFPTPLPNYALPLVVSGYTISALAILPPLFPYDGHLLAYALGNWLGLSMWASRLAHTRQPGFAAKTSAGKTVFHWFTVLSLPVWLWVLFANRRPIDFSLPLALTTLAWVMVMSSYWLGRVDRIYRIPWWLVGMAVSVAAPVVAFIIVPNGLTLAVTLLAAGLLYFTDAVIRRQRGELVPAGLVTAGGYLLLLSRLQVSFDALSFALALLIAVYFLVSLRREQKRSAIFTHQYLAPLYITSHLLSLFLLWRIYVRPLDRLFFDLPWTDEMRLWGAAAQFLLGLIYGLYAWSTYKERWGHVAAWLIAAAGAFIAITYSTGRGSAAAKAALLAIAFVLVERGLYWLRQRPGIRNRQQAFIRLTWRLYRRPLLVAGWAISAIAIGLAIVRNLWLLGRGYTQQTWAVIGLLLLTGLYALSARLFRQARFVWLAAILIFAPWTILTNLGWFTVYRPTGFGFALSWVGLAWFLYLTGLVLSRLVPVAYTRPLKSVAHVLMPFALLWGLADADTSRFTFGLAVGFYGLMAILEHHRLKEIEARYSGWHTIFLYPALGLMPVWCVYLLAWLWPAAQHQYFGLMLLVFGLLGLAAGQWLNRAAPKPDLATLYGLPPYLISYGAMIVGTLMVGHISSLRTLALLYDALLMLVSAYLFKKPVWVYLAAVILPLSLLSALAGAGVPGNRYGWWLIGLASIYLMLAWALRGGKLSEYGLAPLTTGFTLIALSLPPSSQDQTGALWGYGSAALLFGISAFWLHQALLLTPACALAVVPYAIGIKELGISSNYYGLALLPGAVIALTLGWWLDRHFGSWQDFPWSQASRWPAALGNRMLGWWGLPVSTLGFGLAIVSPIFTSVSGLRALNFVLLMPILGWAIYRFRLRGWLFALALAGHLAAVYWLDELGWWNWPHTLAETWLRFLPITLVTALVALFIERYRQEKTPLSSQYLLQGWSRPLYIILLLDILVGQLFGLEASWAALMISLTHIFILATLASFWLSRGVVYVSLVLGVVSLGQWLLILDKSIESFLIAAAWLALGYGLVGYGLTLLRSNLTENRELRPWVTVWESSLQRFSLVFSLIILILTIALGLKIIGWTVRVMFDLSFRNMVAIATVQMVVGVFALLGLLYLATAFIHHKQRLGYAATAMLLIGWILRVFYIQQWDNVQWYAVPAGLYLLGIGYLEWQNGNRVLGRWLDYLAMLLMMGSLFWQILLFGWWYALALGLEGLLAVWWGSARRLRRFLYGGIAGVVLATVGQLINSLRSINQWIVFGAIGLMLVIMAIFIERKLEDIKAWQEILETWE